MVIYMNVCITVYVCVRVRGSGGGPKGLFTRGSDFALD